MWCTLSCAERRLILGKFDQHGAVLTLEDENMVNDENKPSIEINDNNEVAPCSRL
jgi:hypothetical protein